jgi:hypothetical protein
MQFPDSRLISLVLNAAALEGDDLVPGPHSGSLSRTADRHVVHKVGTLRRLVRKIEAEFDGGRLFESKRNHPETGVEQGGCGENDRQRPQRGVKPSRSAAVGKR